jgi:hypothetical protein
MGTHSSSEAEKKDQCKKAPMEIKAATKIKKTWATLLEKAIMKTQFYRLNAE